MQITELYRTQFDDTQYIVFQVDASISSSEILLLKRHNNIITVYNPVDESESISDEAISWIKQYE